MIAPTVTVTVTVTVAAPAPSARRSATCRRFLTAAPIAARPSIHAAAKPNRFPTTPRTGGPEPVPFLRLRETCAGFTARPS